MTHNLVSDQVWYFYILSRTGFSFRTTVNSHEAQVPNIRQILNLFVAVTL